MYEKCSFLWVLDIPFLHCLRAFEEWIVCLSYYPFLYLSYYYSILKMPSSLLPVVEERIQHSTTIANHIYSACNLFSSSFYLYYSRDSNPNKLISKNIVPEYIRYYTRTDESREIIAHLASRIVCLVVHTGHILFFIKSRDFSRCGERSVR